MRDGCDSGEISGAPRGSAHVEPGQPLGVLGALLDRLHVGAPRSLAAPAHECAHRVGVAFEHGLDRAVRAVGDPARHAPSAGLAAGAVSEEDALHAAVHHNPAAYRVTHRIVRALTETKPTTTPWGADSEYGRLLDVLLCPPDHFRWLPASAIARATLESGLSFSPEDAKRQHAEMVSVYEAAGVGVHFLEPEPALPYQVFARDSSITVPQGPIVTQCHQWWRRGEYAPVIRFYQQNDIRIHRMITAAALEGGDFMVVEPGVAVIGNGEERTQEPAARGLARGRRLGGPHRAYPAALPPHRRPGGDARREARRRLRRAGGRRLRSLARGEGSRDR